MLDFIFNSIIKFTPSLLQPERVLAKIREQGPRRYFVHTGWNLLGRVVNLVIAFFVNIYIVRYFGPSDWGLLSYVVSFTGIFSFIATLGVDSILYIDLVKEPTLRDKLLGTGAWLKAIGGAAAFLLVIVFSVISGNNMYTTLLMMLVASSFFFQSINVVNLYFQANVQSRPTVVISLVISLFLSALKVLFVWQLFSITAIASIYFIEGALTALGNFIIYKRAGLSIFSWSIDKIMAKRILAVSWPLIISSAFAFIYSRIDQVMIKQMMDSSAVGFYDTGVRIAEMWYIFPSIIVGSMFPAIINAKKISFQFFEERLIKLYALTIYLTLIFILPLSLLAAPIIHLLYGPVFAPAAGVLKVYVWAGISVTLATVINQYLISEKLTRIALFLNFAGMALNIILNIMFIPRFGITGAAWATLCSYSLIPVCVVFFPESRKQIVYIMTAIIKPLKKLTK